MTAIEMYQQTFGHDPAELAALRADRARLDWLAENRVSVFSPGDDRARPWFLVGPEGALFSAADIREAIDRAMAAGVTEGGADHADRT